MPDSYFCKSAIVTVRHICLFDNHIEGTSPSISVSGRTNAPIAQSALAHKLARAAFYIMRDRVPFMPEKAFA
jgi:hypothetical protein